jgi:hypothetical protein
MVVAAFNRILDGSRGLGLDNAFFRWNSLFTNGFNTDFSSVDSFSLNLVTGFEAGFE